ncbi:hypothetical protein AC579_6129 [Pseudocercospora musae]|uniref:Uncharacterized protein n=1 Tax=Pseudocercospora musae TaxID=113226 RepID=A0A139IM66_9PEZI|nr:hypothetical protein AC579_6129 [Pseudocercospora musae]
MSYAHDTSKSEGSINTTTNQNFGDCMTQRLLRPNAEDGNPEQTSEPKSWRRRALSIARPYGQARAVVARIGKLFRPRASASQSPRERDNVGLSVLRKAPEKKQGSVPIFRQALPREEQRQRHAEEEERYELELDEFDLRFHQGKNSLDLARERLSHSPSSSRTEPSEKGSEKVYRLGTVSLRL